MQIQWIHAFLKVAALKNFSDASEELFISQSTLSKNIQSLEKELNIRLFDRSTRSISITPIAEQLIQYSASICDNYDKILDTIQKHDYQSQHTIRLYCTPIMHLYRLTDLLFKFRNKYPDIDFIIDESTLNIALKNMGNRHADIAIIRMENDAKYDQYNIISLWEDELVILCGNGNPLSDRTKVPLKEAITHRLYMLQGSHEILSNALKRYNLTLDTSQIGASLNGFAISNILQHNVGISLMVKSMASKLSVMDNLCIVPLAEHPIYPVKLITNKEYLTKSAEKLIDFLLENIKAENV